MSIETSSKYFPAEEKLLRGVPWVGRLSFSELRKKVKEIAARPIMCSACGAALTNPNLIKEDPRRGKYFICEFCGTMNVIPKDLMPGTDLSEFVLGRVTTRTPIREHALLAVIDISGSMAGAKLRAVKESLQRTIVDLSVNAPSTAFGLIAFHSEVYIYDEEMNKILTISGDTRYSVEKIEKATLKAMKRIKLKPLKETRKKWERNIDGLRSLDMTALGPAMVAAYTIMKEQGGRILLLTDGLANEGVGALEGASTTGAKLYEELADKAANAGIIIDVVGIKDPSAFMALEALAVMPMVTGGNMYYAETEELAETITTRARGEVVARGVKVRVIAPKGVEIAEVSGLGLPKPEEIRSGVKMGAVTSDREIYVRLAPSAKLNVDEVPIQMQISYMDEEGNRRLRVITRRVKVTKEARPIFETLKAELPATFAVQRAGEEQYRGDLERSRAILEQTQRAMRSVQAEAPKLAKALSRVDKILQEQIVQAEEAAERAKREAMRRAAPMRATMKAVIADEDAARSIQQTRLTAKELFEKEEEEE